MSAATFDQVVVLGDIGGHRRVLRHVLGTLGVDVDDGTIPPNTCIIQVGDLIGGRSASDQNSVDAPSASPTAPARRQPRKRSRRSPCRQPRGEPSSCGRRSTRAVTAPFVESEAPRWRSASKSSCRGCPKASR